MDYKIIIMNDMYWEQHSRWMVVMESSSTALKLVLIRRFTVTITLYSYILDVEKK